MCVYAETAVSPRANAAMIAKTIHVYAPAKVAVSFPVNTVSIAVSVTASLALPAKRVISCVFRVTSATLDATKIARSAPTAAIAFQKPAKVAVKIASAA